MASKPRNCYPHLLDTGEAISGILSLVRSCLMKREIEKLEIALQKTTVTIKGLKHVSWKEIWRARLLWLGNEKAKKGTRSNLWVQLKDS